MTEKKINNSFNAEAFKKRVPQPLRSVTLNFLVDDKKVLLAMKKRGFGAGKWNGYGGKPELNESMESAMIRETQEEIGVTPIEYTRVGQIAFYFPLIPIEDDWNQLVEIYITKKWHGQPVETEEMKPEWFAFSEIPFDQMWPDDRYFMPKLLAGEPILGEFFFGKDEEILSYSL